MHIKIIFTQETITVGEFKLHVSSMEPYNEILAQINHPKHLSSSHYGFFFILAIRDAMQARYPGCEMKAQLVNGEMK